MAGKGRPPKIPPEDIPQIIDDIVQGRKKKSEIARDYGVAQASLDGLMKRHKEKRGVTDEDLKALPSIVENHILSYMDFEVNFKKYQEKYGDDVWNYHYNMQVAHKLGVQGYAKNINLLKHKMEKILEKDTITVLRNAGDGVQVKEEMPVDLQHSKHLKDLANTLSCLSYTEGIHQKEAKVNINNNNLNAQQNNTSVQQDTVQKTLQNIKQDPTDLINYVKSPEFKGG